MRSSPYQRRKNKRIRERKRAQDRRAKYCSRYDWLTSEEYTPKPTQDIGVMEPTSGKRYPSMLRDDISEVSEIESDISTMSDPTISRYSEVVSLLTNGTARPGYKCVCHMYYRRDCFCYGCSYIVYDKVYGNLLACLHSASSHCSGCVCKWCLPEKMIQMITYQCATCVNTSVLLIEGKMANIDAMSARMYYNYVINILSSRCEAIDKPTCSAH